MTALALYLPQGAQAQDRAPGPPALDIILVGLVGPETESNTLRASCYSQTFTFTVDNRRAGPSVLIDARLDGRPPRDPESTDALRQFLAGARNVHFTGATCYSEDAINVGLSGLLGSPAPGQDDAFLRLFRISF